jgi:glycosyltransferase involved in cell wall biosynthesis
MCNLNHLSLYKNSKDSRSFVLHKNDSGISADRDIKVIDSKNSLTDDRSLVSIIIPTYDAYRDGLFPELLKQLSNQTYQNFEIIIIKGDSRQGRAINTGAGLSKGKYLLTLDDDTRIYDREILNKLTRVMNKDETIGMAGGINVIPKDATPFIKRVLMIRKDVFIKVGGENEIIPRGLDPYLRNEFRRVGYRVVVVPNVNYSHLTPPSFLKLIKQFYRNGKQAAFCNKLFPQWVIETPSSHTNNFKAKRTFWYRIYRYVMNMVITLLKGHWIYLSASTAYASGFMWAYITLRENDQE